MHLIAQHRKLHLRYLLKHLREDGTFFFSLSAFSQSSFECVDLARQAHGAWVLARAHKILGGDELKSAAGKVIDSLLDQVVHEEMKFG